jgi:hypothetical protein
MKGATYIYNGDLPLTGKINSGLFGVDGHWTQRLQQAMARSRFRHLQHHKYKSDKPNKKYYMMIKRFILVRLPHLILHFIKTRSANNYILIGTRIMKTGLNQVLIRLASGPAGCYGIYQQ